MANMSYCRFQNTVTDLTDCQGALDNDDPTDLGPEETRARRRLIQIAINIALNHGHDVDMPVIQEY